MHPLDCPAWDYSSYPTHVKEVPLRVFNILMALGTKRIDTLALATDTRDAHERIFVELTPPAFRYFAGHYRGEPFRCLRFYAVGVHGDPRVGALPQMVGRLMGEIADQVSQGVAALDAS